MLALYIQNQIQQKNADRKSAFTSGRYQNSWKQPLAEAFLERTCQRLVLKRLQRKNKKKKVSGSVSSQLVEEFAYTENLEEAAGILLANGFDVTSYQCLLDLIRTYPELCISIKEKLLMLKHCEYRGVQLPSHQFHLRKAGLKKTWKKVM